MTKPIVLSGCQPSGQLTIGNYMGALKQWVAMQEDHDCLYMLVDLHAITVRQEPQKLYEACLDGLALYVACGIDPVKSTLFVQSHVPEHAQLAWIMNCYTQMGELNRMTQFKDKSAKRETDFVAAGLFTYPALQAADILLYDADEVPVGDDQRQHIEITRDIAIRFNSRFGETFVIPEAVTPAAGARVMDLQAPTSKMSKSADSDAGCVFLLDDPKAIEKKFKRAVTDSESEVRYSVTEKPGVSNLLDILAAAGGGTPAQLAEKYNQYGPLKADAASAVIAMLEPIQHRYRELMNDPGELQRLLNIGANRAQEQASATLSRAYEAIGLLPR